MKVPSGAAMIASPPAAWTTVRLDLPRTITLDGAAATRMGFTPSPSASAKIRQARPRAPARAAHDLEAAAHLRYRRGPSAALPYSAEAILRDGASITIRPRMVRPR